MAATKTDWFIKFGNSNLNHVLSVRLGMDYLVEVQLVLLGEVQGQSY